MSDQSVESRSVYLRRRALATAGAVLGVIALIWIIGALIGSDDVTPQPLDAAAMAPASAPPSTMSSPPASSSTAPPTSSAAESPTGPPPAPPPPPPDPNQPCQDAAMAVTTEIGAPHYQVGQRPLLRLVVRNVGQVPCTRDLGHELRELVITTQDGATRLWSSNDCYSPKGPEPTIIQPGEPKLFDVTWAGRTSAPGCPAKRATVQPGTYAVTPRLGPLVGASVPLVMTAR